MARVRIWISGVQGIGNVFMIQHDDGREFYQPLRNPPLPGEKIGSTYRGDFKGYAGTYYDLPPGFPTTNETAASRLMDPSIPKPIQRLIRENFPLKIRPEVAPRPQHPRQPLSVARS